MLMVMCEELCHASLYRDTTAVCVHTAWRERKSQRSQYGTTGTTIDRRRTRAVDTGTVDLGTVESPQNTGNVVKCGSIF